MGSQQRWGQGEGEAGVGRPRHVEPRKRAICVMSWLPGHSTLRSQFPCFPSRLPHPPRVSLLPVRLCCGWVLGFELLKMGWIQSSLPPSLSASLQKQGVSSCTFHGLKLKLSFSIAAPPPPFWVTFLSPPTIVTSDCPQTALDWQLHVCTCPSHLMFTFAP